MVTDANLRSFLTGDSYVVLHTKELKNSFEYHAHFWLGAESTLDETGAAAYKVNDRENALYTIQAHTCTPAISGGSGLSDHTYVRNDRHPCMRALSYLIHTPRRYAHSPSQCFRARADTSVCWSGGGAQRQVRRRRASVPRNSRQRERAV